MLYFSLKYIRDTHRRSFCFSNNHNFQTISTGFVIFFYYLWCQIVFFSVFPRKMKLRATHSNREAFILNAACRWKFKQNSNTDTNSCGHTNAHTCSPHHCLTVNTPSTVKIARKLLSIYLSLCNPVPMVLHNTNLPTIQFVCTKIK